MKRPNERELQHHCDAWNAAHPIGREVLLTRDDGSTIPTRTRTGAQVLGGHSAVIWVEGISACQHLARVAPANTNTNGSAI